MKNIQILGILIMLFTACGREQKQKIVHSNNGDKKVVTIKKDTTRIPVADLPVHIDSTNYLLHPIGDYEIGNNRGKLRYSSSVSRVDDFSISNFGGSSITGNLDNIMFQRLDSDKLLPLTHKTIKIQSLTFLRQIFNTTKRQLLIYKVIDKDTNQDGRLDSNDIHTLYISKIDGTKFKKLTDPNKEIIDWKIIQSLNRLYFRSIEDTNEDGIFDSKDRIHYKYVALNTDKLKVVEYHPI